MQSEYMFFHEENGDDDEDFASSVHHDEHSADPLYERNKVLECGHTYLEHVWYDKP